MSTALGTRRAAPPDASRPPGRSAPAPVALTALALLGLSFVWRLWLLRAREFDPDEFEHLHGAWLIAQGFLPYRDYFEHHTPWYWFLLAPFYAFFDVAGNPADAIDFLFFARGMSWVLTGLALAATVWLGTRWRGARTGWVAALFLSGTLMFLARTLEVRPDVLALGFWLCCLVAGVRGFRSAYAGAGPATASVSMKGAAARPWMVVSAALLGAAVMTTQKYLFALPGYSVALAWYLVDQRSLRPWRERLGDVLLAAAAFLAPAVLTAAYFALRGALAEFAYYNVTWNMGWEQHFPPWRMLRHLATENPFLVSLGFLGAAGLLAGVLSRRALRRGDLLLLASFGSLFLGLLIMPAAYEQYYVTFLPLLGLFAATALTTIVDGAAALRERLPARRWAALAIASVAALVGALALAAAWARVAQPEWTMYGPGFLAIWAAALAAAAVLVFRRRPDWALAVLLVGLAARPLHQLRQQFELSNAAQLAGVRYVLEHTRPQDTVLDGWTGYGVFRPHAWFYFVLPRDVRLELGEEERGDLLEGLRSGRVDPRLVVFDRDLREFSPEVTALLEARYQPVGLNDIWGKAREGSSTRRRAGAADRSAGVAGAEATYVSAERGRCTGPSASERRSWRA